MAKGYLATVSQQEAIEWTKDIVTNPEIPMRERRGLIDFLTHPDNQRQKLLTDVGSALTDRGQAIEFLNLVLESGVSRRTPSYYEALALFPDDESRLANLEKLAKNRYQRGRIRDVSARLFEDLAELGHSDADIQRVASALKEK